MSNPGYLTDAELTVVDDAGNRLSVIYAPSWLKAAAALEDAFGFAPRITVTGGQPVGAYRTAEQQRVVSPGTPPSWSDHCKGRAVDITNQRAFRNRNQDRFVEILAANGWLNVKTSGKPFPSEPWHFANQSSNPAGGGTPIETEEEDDMEPKIIGHKDQEVAIIAAWLPDGYLTAKLDTDVAVGWARLYSPTKDSLVPMYERDVYLTMIAGAKALAVGYQAGLPKPGGGSDNSEVLKAVAGLPSKTDLEATRDQIVAKIPTKLTP